MWLTYTQKLIIVLPTQGGQELNYSGLELIEQLGDKYWLAVMEKP